MVKLPNEIFYQLATFEIGMLTSEKHIRYLYPLGTLTPDRSSPVTQRDTFYRSVVTLIPRPSLLDTQPLLGDLSSSETFTIPPIIHTYHH